MKAHEVSAQEIQEGMAIRTCFGVDVVKAVKPYRNQRLNQNKSILGTIELMSGMRMTNMVFSKYALADRPAPVCPEVKDEVQVEQQSLEF